MASLCESLTSNTTLRTLRLSDNQSFSLEDQPSVVEEGADSSAALWSGSDQKRRSAVAWAFWKALKTSTRFGHDGNSTLTSLSLNGNHLDPASIDALVDA